MTRDGRTNDKIRVRVSLGLVGINLAMAVVAGLWVNLNHRAWSRGCVRRLASMAPLAFVSLAVIEVAVPLFVVEPDRVRCNHRLFNRNVPIDGLADLELAKRTLWRRSDGRRIVTTFGTRPTDVQRLRAALDRAR